MEQFKRMKQLYHDLLSQHEVYWKQRAKAFWLRDGDHITRFFHSTATARKKKNQISQLKDVNCDWQTWDINLGQVMVDYFNIVFTTKACDSGNVLDCIPVLVYEDDSNILLRPYSVEEVRSAMFFMHPDKSLGLEGFNPGLYQQYWDVVGPKSWLLAFGCIS